ncbi:MAG TPA: alpha/beta hydrolase [Candidatus Acidoferrales bacterium]|nr:alpha/beta hydrolase [Candidatus Acidoferrales bacterium]
MEQPAPKSSFVTVNGVRLHVLDWGGAGAPIVLLHATGLLGRVYRPLAERLCSIGHVYSYDQRGHGDSSSAPDGVYDWDWTMKDLAGFIAARGWSGVRAIGHSAGATAIGSLAAEQPGLISRAVLVEPVVFESPDAPELGWRNPFIEKTLKRKRVFDHVEAMFSNFDRKPPYATWHKDILLDYCEFGTRPTRDGRRELKCTPEIEAKFYETARDFDGLGKILKAEVPMLVMFGTRGDSLGATLSARIARQLKNGRVIDVPDTGHFMPMEQPEYVAEQAIEFLSAS